MSKKLTVAIPTLNRNEYLVKLLRTIPFNFSGKVLVSDNESHVTKSIKDQFFNFDFISTKEKMEMFSNWNNALDNVNTEFFVMPSDDDLFNEISFKNFEYYLDKYPDYDIFVFGHNIVDRNDIVLSSWKPKKLCKFNKIRGFNEFQKGVQARCPSIIFRTQLARDLGRFNENLEFTAADSLLIQQCLLYGKSVFIPEIVSSYRVWENSFTSKLIKTKEWMNKIELWTDILKNILIRDFSNTYSKNTINNIKDEICARNLIGGIYEIRKNQNILSALDFLLSNRYPLKADFKSQLLLIKAIIRG